MCITVCFTIIPPQPENSKKTKETPLSSTDKTPLFHKGDGRNVHVQTKGCMFVM